MAEHGSGRVEVHETVAGFRAALEEVRRSGRTVGFVPTMGYLHDGHVSLMREAAVQNDVAVASIFVNPLQFAASEDLSTYPRDLARDLELSGEAGVRHVLHPDVREMYPEPVLTTVSVATITRLFEGAARPEHFAGVATVVAKLFSIAGPCRAYFGEKDYQQLAVVRRMAADLSMPVEVVGCPIVRDSDGLALSSRNVYLSDAQRAAAPALHEALEAVVTAAAAGERNADALRSILVERVSDESEAVLDYAEVVDALTLEPASVIGGEQRVLLAAHFGSTRLLDNVALVTHH
ncbi:MAG: pantoate--beta-alanine ligase [Aquihabitans sp.]